RSHWEPVAMIQLGFSVSILRFVERTPGRPAIRAGLAASAQATVVRRSFGEGGTRPTVLETTSSLSLEHDPQTEPELAFVDTLASEILHAGNRHEILAIADVVVRDREVRRVREVERFHAELQPEPIGEREFAQEP